MIKLIKLRCSSSCVRMLEAPKYSTTIKKNTLKSLKSLATAFLEI